jgi:hypothetical protein
LIKSQFDEVIEPKVARVGLARKKELGLKASFSKRTILV